MRELTTAEQIMQRYNLDEGNPYQRLLVQSQIAKLDRHIKHHEGYYIITFDDGSQILYTYQTGEYSLPYSQL